MKSLQASACCGSTLLLALLCATAAFALGTSVSREHNVRIFNSLLVSVYLPHGEWIAKRILVWSWHVVYGDGHGSRM